MSAARKLLDHNPVVKTLLTSERPSLLDELMLTSVHEIVQLINYWNGRLQNAPADKQDFIQHQVDKLEEILIERTNVTAHVATVGQIEPEVVDAPKTKKPVVQQAKKDKNGNVKVVPLPIQKKSTDKGLSTAQRLQNLLKEYYVNTLNLKAAKTPYLALEDLSSVASIINQYSTDKEYADVLSLLKSELVALNEGLDEEVVENFYNFHSANDASSIERVYIDLIEANQEKHPNVNILQGERIVSDPDVIAEEITKEYAQGSQTEIENLDDNDLYILTREIFANIAGTYTSDKKERRHMANETLEYATKYVSAYAAFNNAPGVSTPAPTESKKEGDAVTVVKRSDIEDKLKKVISFSINRGDKLNKHDVVESVMSSVFKDDSGKIVTTDIYDGEELDRHVEKDSQATDYVFKLYNVIYKSRWEWMKKKNQKVDHPKPIEQKPKAEKPVAKKDKPTPKSDNLLKFTSINEIMPKAKELVKQGKTLDDLKKWGVRNMLNIRMKEQDESAIMTNSTEIERFIESMVSDLFTRKFDDAKDEVKEFLSGEFKKDSSLTFTQARDRVQFFLEENNITYKDADVINLVKASMDENKNSKLTPEEIKGRIRNAYKVVTSKMEIPVISEAIGPNNISVKMISDKSFSELISLIEKELPGKNSEVTSFLKTKEGLDTVEASLKNDGYYIHEEKQSKQEPKKETSNETNDVEKDAREIFDIISEDKEFKSKASALYSVKKKAKELGYKPSDPLMEFLNGSGAFKLISSFMGEETKEDKPGPVQSKEIKTEKEIANESQEEPAEEESGEEETVITEKFSTVEPGAWSKIQKYTDLDKIAIAATVIKDDGGWEKALSMVYEASTDGSCEELKNMSDDEVTEWFNENVIGVTEEDNSTESTENENPDNTAAKEEDNNEEPEVFKKLAESRSKAKFKQALQEIMKSVDDSKELREKIMKIIKHAKTSYLKKLSNGNPKDIHLMMTKAKEA